MKAKQRRIAGDALSWALGVGLGLLLGIALLIGMSRLAPESVMEGDGTSTAAEATADSAAAKIGGDSSAESAPAQSSEAPANASAAPETPAPEAAAASTMPATPAVAGSTMPAAPAVAGTSAEGAGDAAAGKEVFVGTCGGCHGANGEGGIGPALNAAAGWDIAGFTQALREGKTPDGRELAAMMPRFSPAQLDDAQVANIHAFVQTLK
ncbi:c-type cytochrome [Deinococcus lacus]|uniref:C-type cytochrome n=1 Tax=Deinococcus lacus TaxID=392561 RepID=A0ABW1YCA9_9DEIO